MRDQGNFVVTPDHQDLGATPSSSRARLALRSAPVRAAAPAWAVVLLCLCYIGYFKGTALVRSLPVDATLLFALATCAGLVAHVVGRRTTTKRALIPIVALWAVFGLGATLTIGAHRSFDKV